MTGPLYFAHERARVVDLPHRHAVLARVAQPALGPRLAEDHLGLPPPRLVGSAAVPAAAGPRLPALADVHRLRRRGGRAAGGGRDPVRAVAPRDHGTVTRRGIG